VNVIVYKLLRWRPKSAIVARRCWFHRLSVQYNFIFAIIRDIAFHFPPDCQQWWRLYSQLFILLRILHIISTVCFPRQ